MNESRLGYILQGGYILGGVDPYVQTRVKILFEGELKMIGITDISKSNVLKFTY